MVEIPYYSIIQLFNYSIIQLFNFTRHPFTEKVDYHPCFH